MNTGVLAFQLIVTSVTDLFLDNTGGVEVRLTTDAAIPSSVVPGQAYGEVNQETLQARAMLSTQKHRPNLGGGPAYVRRCI